MKGTGPRPPPPPVEVLPETEATREQRQHIGEKALVALCSVLRNARSYSWEHEVFAAQLDAVQQAMLELLGSDGTFELDLAGDAFHVNGQPIRLQPAAAGADRGPDRAGPGRLATLDADAVPRARPSEGRRERPLLGSARRQRGGARHHLRLAARVLQEAAPRPGDGGDVPRRGDGGD